MQLTQFKFEDMVTLNGNQVMTTSLKVANFFGRKHKTILRAIRNLKCSNEFNERNYVPVTYVDEKGELREMYNLTRDGCMFLIMGFTGESAAHIKEGYINAFNWMAEQLYKIQHGFMEEQNAVMLEFMKEKDIASLSGRLLRKWGREKKPALMSRMKQLEEQSQIKLTLN